MAGVEKSLEVVKVLGDLADCVEAVLEDGKVTLADAKVLPKLVGCVKVLMADVPAVKEELKDLDKPELEQLVGALVDAVLKLVDKLPKSE
jgi:hypothetical protein